MSAQEKVQGATLKKRKASTNLDVIASLEDSLETPQEKKVRLRSIFVVHFSLLVASLGSSIIFTGVYPYLIQMDPSVAMIEYGIVVAADAAAQMICAPLFGAWVDRIKTVRPVFLICCTLFCAGNVLYAMVGMFNRNDIFGVEIRGARIWVMLFARFVVGAGTALNSAGRYYITQATLVSERTTQISILSLFQTLGFIMGPGIQAGLTPLGPGAIGDEGTLVFDMYTSTGWVSAATGVLCFLLFTPLVFRESFISEKELAAVQKMVKEDTTTGNAKQLVRRISQIQLGQHTESRDTDSNGRPRQLLREFSKISVVETAGLNIKDNLKEVKGGDQNNIPAQPLPKLAMFTSVYNFFAFLANFVLLETIMVKLAMDQWGWVAADAIQNMGFMIMGAGGISVFAFACIGPLSRRFDERLLLVVLGMVPMILGRVVMFPIPGQPNPPGFQTNDPNAPLMTTSQAPLIALNSSLPDPYASHGTALGEFARGCGYDWCREVPAIHIAQFMVGFVVATIGYPFCTTLTASIYSKLLGANNPGFWLGLFTTFGSLARVLGPLLVTEIYEQWGTYVLFAVVTATLVVSLVLTLASWRSLVPAAHAGQPKAEQKELEQKVVADKPPAIIVEE